MVNNALSLVPPAVLHDVSIVDTKITPVWNTMGVIPGHIKDEVVVVGNHRDGTCWTSTDSTAEDVAFV